MEAVSAVPGWSVRGWGRWEASVPGSSVAGTDDGLGCRFDRLRARSRLLGSVAPSAAVRSRRGPDRGDGPEPWVRWNRSALPAVRAGTGALYLDVEFGRGALSDSSIAVHAVAVPGPEGTVGTLPLGAIGRVNLGVGAGVLRTVVVGVASSGSDAPPHAAITKPKPMVDPAIHASARRRSSEARNCSIPRAAWSPIRGDLAPAGSRAERTTLGGGKHGASGERPGIAEPISGSTVSRWGRGSGTPNGARRCHVAAPTASRSTGSSMIALSCMPRPGPPFRCWGECSTRSVHLATTSGASFHQDRESVNSSGAGAAQPNCPGSSFDR